LKEVNLTLDPGDWKHFEELGRDAVFLEIPVGRSILDASPHQNKKILIGSHLGDTPPHFEILFF
jgi:hypothetical protein